MLNNDLIFVTQSKGVRKHFEDVAENAFSLEKPHIDFTNRKYFTLFLKL